MSSCNTIFSPKSDEVSDDGVVSFHSVGAIDQLLHGCWEYSRQIPKKKARNRRVIGVLFVSSSQILPLWLIEPAKAAAASKLTSTAKGAVQSRAKRGARVMRKNEKKKKASFLPQTELSCLPPITAVNFPPQILASLMALGPWSQSSDTPEMPR